MVDDSVLEAILMSGVSLPAPSGSVRQLRAALADDRSGPRELATIAARDPVLVGALTRIANSPAFYHQGSARSLVDVVARLGGTKTLAIAVSAAMKSALSGVDQRIVDAVWERSAHVASRPCAAWRPHASTPRRWPSTPSPVRRTRRSARSSRATGPFGRPGGY